MFSAGSLFSGMGGAPSPAPKTDSSVIVNINGMIEEAKSECQNADNSTTWFNIFRCSDAFTVKSDCDEQLLFNLYFKSPVKIHHLLIRAPSMETAPLMMKLFVNRAPMSFADVESIDPIEEIEIQEGELQGEIILNFVKYQNVSSVTIFIENNRDGGDVTEISKMELHGAPLLDTDMKNLKKVG